MTEAELDHRFIDTSGLRLHVAQAGPLGGEPIVLLHGFPDAGFGWRFQIAALARAGLRVIVPDQRGYNTSDKPRGVRQYSLDKLVEDLAGLADALNYDRFHLVGHDWGGIVAWAAGAWMPDRIEKLVILNAPHPEVIIPYALRSPSQLLAAFFQLPWLPEALLSTRRSALLARALVKSGRPDTFTQEEIARYRTAWQRPSALTGMLNWYRALPFRPKMRQRIITPTLLLWGMQDPALEAGLALCSLGYCDDGRLKRFEAASHWVQRDEADAVNKELLSFLGCTPASGASRRSP